MKKDVAIYVSFVKTKINKDQFSKLEKMFGPTVDCLYEYTAINSGGYQPERIKDGIIQPNDMQKPQNVHSPKMDESKKIAICSMPFNRFVVTPDAFLTVCCSDIANNLVVADLNKVSLREAWFSEEAKNIRAVLLSGEISENCQCYNCIHNTDNPIEPLCDWIKEA
ncbi:hypothetical protein FACS189491_12050 [Spirochaetia bacterium]|nr:hypothetical protein FACS189491_12050 [Spirochaetia bacterium]